MNAYLALMAGDHLINGWLVILLFLVYMIVGTFYLRGNSFSSLFQNPWLSVLMSFLSTATLFFVISLIANWNDMVFNIWVPTTVYSLIDTYVQKRKLFYTRKNEKNNNPAVA
jgi:ABC-type transport system involved in multi-copper enzyme maturation permease subunit